MAKLIFPIDFGIEFEGGSFRAEATSEKELADIISQELVDAPHDVVKRLEREVISLSKQTSPQQTHLSKDVANFQIEVFYVEGIRKCQLSLEQKLENLTKQKEFVLNRMAALKKIQENRMNLEENF